MGGQLPPVSVGGPLEAWGTLKEKSWVRSPLVGVSTAAEDVAKRGPEVYGFLILTKVYGEWITCKW